MAKRPTKARKTTAVAESPREEGRQGDDRTPQPKGGESPPNGPVPPPALDDRERRLEERELRLDEREKDAARLQERLAAEETTLREARVRLENLEQNLLQKEEDLFIQQAALDEARDLAVELEAATTSAGSAPEGGDLLDRPDAAFLEGLADDFLLEGPAAPPAAIPAPPRAEPVAEPPPAPAPDAAAREQDAAERRAEELKRLKLEVESLLTLAQDLSFLSFLEPRVQRTVKDETLDWPTMAGFYNLTARLLKEELEKSWLLLAKTEADGKQELQQRDRALLEANAAIAGLQEDFERYRTRMKQEQEGMQARANEELLRRIVPISDNFARALTAAQDATNVEAVVSGVRMIYRLFDDILSREGLIPIPARRGDGFDPKVHEALMEVETEEVADDAIYEEVQRGYYLAGKVFRPALVKVARNHGAPAAPGPAEPPTPPEQ